MKENGAVLCVSEQEKQQILAALRYWQTGERTRLLEEPLTEGEVTTLIDSIDTEDNSCHETLGMTQGHKYIRCGKPAVAIIGNRDPRPYLMCGHCAHHNVHNRRGQLLYAMPGFKV